MIVFWLMVSTPLVILFFFTCYGLWLLGGLIADKIDQRRYRKRMQSR